MITHVTLPEATANIVQLLERVLNGEEIIIFQSGQPIAHIMSPATRDRLPEQLDDRASIPFNTNNPLLNPNLVSLFNLADSTSVTFQPGEEIQISQNNQSIARLIIEPRIIEPRKLRKARRPGSAIGTITIVDDDDEHLEAFRDYMP